MESHGGASTFSVGVEDAQGCVYDIDVFEYSSHHLLGCGLSDTTRSRCYCVLVALDKFSRFCHFSHFCRFSQTISLQSLSDLGRLLNTISQHILTLSSAVFW